MNSDHFGRFSVRQGDHLVRHEMSFEGVGICARASITIIVLVSFRIENFPNPNTRVICSVAYSHLVNPAESFSMTLFSIGNSLAVGNFSGLNW